MRTSHYVLPGVATLVAASGLPLPAGAVSPDYVFSRPVQAAEHTYAWYRQTHAQTAKAFGLDPAAVGDGMDTWHWWVGVDNPLFWREFAKLSGKREIANLTNAKIDFLRMLMTVPRAQRFKQMGVINDPDTVPADKPDQYGLTLDRMKQGSLSWDPEVFGYSSGVIGLQLFKNKAFDPKQWSVAKYMADAGSVEPPYHVGMACAFCHVGFDPNRPPADPAEPKWENVSSNIGNQYFREGMVFGQATTPDTFVYQYLSTQEPGTSETSRFPSDFINNTSPINPLYRVQDRLKLTRTERITPAQAAMLRSIYQHVGLPATTPVGALGGTAAAPTVKVPRVLADGADSMGLVVASTRVYVNEGSGYRDWIQTWALNPWNPAESIKRGFTTREFDIQGKVRQDPQSPWMQTEVRMPNLATFLMSYDHYPLAEAVEAGGKGKPGSAYLETNPAVLRKGKLAFADNCASCHSSKRPDPMPAAPAARQAAWRALVLKDDFLVHNFLSDDQRYPLSELGTNAARALGTNAMAGHTWGQMSSLTYKQNQAAMEPLQDRDAHGKRIDLYNPLTGKHDLRFTARRAYYRTPPLIGVWSRAPFLHNHSVGLYNADPSVAGRMAAYQDGMAKLLQPSRRRGVGSIKVTSQDCKLPDVFPFVKRALPAFADLPDFDAALLMVPKGTPVNLLTNVHPRDVQAVLQAYVDGVLQGQPRSKFAALQRKNGAAARRKMLAKLLAVNTCPDFIEDRGHTYGSQLRPDERQALIEYMKSF